MKKSSSMLDQNRKKLFTLRRLWILQSEIGDNLHANCVFKSGFQL